MAQKKLLFPIMVALLVGALTLSNAVATEVIEEQQVSVSSEDKLFLQDFTKTSRRLSASAMAEKYRELQAMQNQAQAGSKTDANGLLEAASDLQQEEKNFALKIFVSSSMGSGLLKTYIEQAQQYGGSLIFKGLVGDSWTKTRELVFAIAGDGEPASILIHDGEFEEFEVTSVPTIVLVQEDNIADIGEDKQVPKSYDRVVGNIGIRGALELFAAQGALSEQAERLLEVRK